jgi:hypothetical protein
MATLLSHYFHDHCERGQDEICIRAAGDGYLEDNLKCFVWVLLFVVYFVHQRKFSTFMMSLCENVFCVCFSVDAGGNVEICKKK